MPDPATVRNAAPGKCALTVYLYWDSGILWHSTCPQPFIVPLGNRRSISETRWDSFETNDNVSKTKQEILTPDATFIAALIATFIAMCCTCGKDGTSAAPCLMHRNLPQLPGEFWKLGH